MACDTYFELVKSILWMLLPAPNNTTATDTVEIIIHCRAALSFGGGISLIAVTFVGSTFRPVFVNRCLLKSEFLLLWLDPTSIFRLLSCCSNPLLSTMMSSTIMVHGYLAKICSMTLWKISDAVLMPKGNINLHKRVVNVVRGKEA